MGALDSFSGAGEFLGMLVGDAMSAEDRRRRQQSILDERALYAGLPADLVADQEGLVELSPSAYEGLSIDPSTRIAQADTLRQFQGIADAQGMDPQYRAAIAQSQAANATQERAQRGAILDTFARRGSGGSGNALLAALSSQQGSAQRSGMEGIQSAGQATARQYQALADAGALASGMRSADYQQASDKAGAMDRVSQYNATNRQAVNQRNTGSRNQFGLANANLAYQRAGMLGGTYGEERDYLSGEERRKRGLATATGGVVGAGIGYAVGAP